MTFDADLKAGLEVELNVLNIIHRRYPCACVIDKFKGYDIWIPELHKSVEVKFDRMSTRTGNVAIEMEYNDKPSGLQTTTADWWVIFDGIKYTLLTPQGIQSCIDANDIELKSYNGVGDSKHKKVYLIRKELLFSFGVEIK